MINFSDNINTCPLHWQYIEVLKLISRQKKDLNQANLTLIETTLHLYRNHLTYSI